MLSYARDLRRYCKYFNYYIRTGVSPLTSDTRPENDFVFVENRLKALGIPVIPHRADAVGYNRFKALLPEKLLRKKYGFRMQEKVFEHFVSFSLMGLGAKHVYIDIASAQSPYPELFGSLSGCRWMRQDLVYRPGWNGNVIGGNACNLPVPDEYFDRMAMHCAFEHFEGSGDTDFIKEASRVLKPGGMLVIAPLYFAGRHYIVTDPTSTRRRVPIDEGAELVREYTWGNAFGRHYSPDAFYRRIYRGCPLDVTLYIVQNEKECHRTIYAKFVGVFTKK